MKPVQLLIVCMLSVALLFIAPFTRDLRQTNGAVALEVRSASGGPNIAPPNGNVVREGLSQNRHAPVSTTSIGVVRESVQRGPDTVDAIYAEVRIARIEWQREGRFRARHATALKLFHDSAALPLSKGKSLIVDQSQQMMHVYEDGAEIRGIPVSTGRWPMYTPAFRGNVGSYTGTFWTYRGWVDEAWYLFVANGNIYIHSLPYTLVNDRKIYSGAESLGNEPSLHGCIRIHPDDAKWLSKWNPLGVSILIMPPPIS